MIGNVNESVGSYEGTELTQLRRALNCSPKQRLQDLQEMLDFAADAEARNPGLRWAVAQLCRKELER